MIDPNEIPDAAIEAYIRKTRYAAGVIREGDYIALRKAPVTKLLWDDVRFGLAAALPHLLTVATANQPALSDGAPLDAATNA